MLNGEKCEAKHEAEKKRLPSQLAIYKDRLLASHKHAYIASMGAIIVHQLNQPLTAINMRLAKTLEMAEESNCSPKCLKKVKKSLVRALPFM
jgi:C4-dicarboxylate-specific signal transduction histidine kinase